MPGPDDKHVNALARNPSHFLISKMSVFCSARQAVRSYKRSEHLESVDCT